MGSEPGNLPPVRFSLGGRPWQLCVAVASTLATYAFTFEDRFQPKEMIAVFFVSAVIFIYLSFKKARIVIFDDRIEFTDFRAAIEVIRFSDITKVELITGNRSVRTVLTAKISGGTKTRELPYVFKIPFYDLKKYLQKWHNDPLAVIHSLSDGSQDRDVWNAPNAKAT
jgi:hypothetical protein